MSANPKNLTAWAAGDKWKIANWNSIPDWHLHHLLNLPAFAGQPGLGHDQFFTPAASSTSSRGASGPTEPAEILGVTVSGTNLVVNGTNENGGQNFHYAPFFIRRT